MTLLIIMERIADLVEIVNTVHGLKRDRDTWQAVALQYKKAFEDQTKRFQELQNVCFAAQAELENERAEQRRLHALSSQSEHDRRTTFDSADATQTDLRFGTATVFASPLDRKTDRQRRLPTSSHQSEHDCCTAFDGAVDSQADLNFGTATIFTTPKAKTDHPQPPSDDYVNPLFKRAQEFAAQRNYGAALVELERLLRGPMSPKARAEGLLLRSHILWTSGPDDHYNALAACSEALEICNRSSELRSLLSRIQYQRGILFYELGMFGKAREAFDAVGDDYILSDKAREYRRSCEGELGLVSRAKRRSGFHEERNMEGLLAQLEEKGPEACWRRSHSTIRAC